MLNGERAAAKLSFDELATRTGISRRTLMRLLSSVERDIDINVLAAIAQVFNMTPAEAVARGEEWQLRNSPEDLGEDLGNLIRERRRGRPETDTG